MFLLNCTEAGDVIELKCKFLGRIAIDITALQMCLAPAIVLCNKKDESATKLRAYLLVCIIKLVSAEHYRAPK